MKNCIHVNYRFSQIYCHGQFLEDIQTAKLYGDSKTFVDKKLKYDEKVILEKYAILKKENNGKIEKKKLKKFVDENFEDDELEDWEANDFTETPSVANKVNDEEYK